MPNEFLQNEEISVDSIIKIVSKTLDVPAASLLRYNSNTQLPSELPARLLSAPLSGSVLAASFHPFSSSMTAPIPFCAVAPTPSPSESGQRTSSLPSAALRPARQRMPGLATRVAAADRQVRAQAVLLQPSRSCFQTRWFLCFPLRPCHKTVPEPFSYPAGGFCTPEPAAPSQPPHTRYLSRQRVPPKRLDL